MKKGMRKYDMAACALVIAAGITWFAAAEVVYDGSLMEDPFLRSGMFATWYVPLATVYLVKSAWGESCRVAVLAWLSALLVMSAMMSVDVLVTHYKPNSDHCCIPVGMDFACSIFSSFVFTGIIAVSDSFVLRCMRSVRQSIAKRGFVRRALRLGGTVLFAAFLIWAVNGVSYAIGQLRAHAG